MYGQGNYGPQYGQGPQRPMPPYQQPPAGLPLPPPPPYAVPPRGSAYPLGPPPPPPSMTQQGPSGSMSNTGNAYLQPPMTVHGGAGPSPFPAGLPPPPPSSIGLPRVPPPPPPLHGQAMYGLPVHQQGIHHMPLQPPLPPGGLAAQPPPPPPPPSSPPKPPPPPSSSSPSSSGNFSSAPVSSAANATVQSGGVPSSVPMSESGAKIAAHSDNRNDASIYAASAAQDLPPPPPKPADEKVVRNIEVLCQFIAKNGPGFEDMARQKESGNPEFNFLIGGEPGSEASCANEYYLWMKTKCNLESGLDKGQGERDLSQGHADVEPSVKPDAVTRLETSRSPVDSDVDMEDDITQSEKELGVSNSVQPETVSTGDMLEVQKQENGPEYSRESTPALNLSSSVDSLADAKHKPENLSGQVTKIDSPMRLIQNYASDDTSEDDCDPFHEEAKIVKVSPPHKSGFTSSHEDIVHGTMDSKSGKASKLQIGESVTACPGSMLTKDIDKPESVQSGVHEKVNELSSLGKIEGHGKTNRAETSSPNADIQGNSVLESSAFDTISRYKEIENVDRKNTSGDLKVDEFGRLVKAGASDSESDGSYRTRRHGRRGRSRSRSRSPSDRRRRRSPRRSPRRRKERRSRSRSWSPKRRRSRSRSPYRPGDDAGSEKPRRDKVQKRECFDFLKGRCYRGASCRYLHHELEKSDSGRHYKSKEHNREVVASTRSSGFHGGDVSSRLIQQNNEDKGEKLHLHLDKHDGGGFTSKSYDEESKEDSLHDAVRPSLLHKDETFAADAQKGEVSTEGDAQIQRASDKAVSDVPTVANNPLPDMPSADEQVIQNSQAETSVQAHHSLEDDTHKMDKSTKIDSSTIQMSAASLPEVPVSEPVPGNMSKVPAGPSAPTPDPSQVSCFPPLLPLQATSLPQASNQVDYKLMAPSVSFPPQSAPIGNVPAYQAPMPNHPSHYPMPVNTAWSIQPPPQLRPPYVNESSMPGAPFQFQQGNLSLRNDFPSQVVGFQHQPYYLHPSNLPTQPFAGASLIRDDRYSQLTSQGLAISSSLAPGSMPPQPIPFPGDSSVKNMQSYPCDNLALSEPAKPTFQNHSFPHPQAAADSMSSHLGGYSSGLDRNHSSRFLDIGGSKISAHYNPYASTFDQPLPSRFSSAAFTHERDVAAGSKYDSSFSLGNAPIGQIPSDHGSRKMVVSPNSSRARGQTLPMSGGDQYDPLFDSIEPSSGSYKKQAQKQDHGADNSDIMLKFNSRHKVLDVEENNKQKEVGVVAASVSMENDEYGETADAEVGAVENGSPSNADEDAIVAEGEIEIDQVKPEGKSKKNKDSRSMKLFKVAVATFVKEVLKPQWRQGNMSKEVFKTIVKKTVDKVSGAMKNHRVPKSQAKIDHYIDSSRRKLTQLVEGYVSKYKS